MTPPKYKIQLEKPIPPPPPPPPVYNGRGPSTTFNMPQAPVANPNNQHFQYNMTIPELLPPPPGAQPPPVPGGLLPPDKSNQNVPPSPLEKLLSSGIPGGADAQLGQDAIHDAHKFTDIFGSQFIPDTAMMNSISVLMNNKGDKKAKFNFNPGMFQSPDAFMVMPPPAPQKELNLKANAALSFTPEASITFSRAVYPTIQACIDAAPNKSYIYIPTGIYPERLKINKKVALEGTGSISICGADITDNCSLHKITFQCDNHGKGGDVNITNHAIVSFSNVSFFTNETNALAIKEDSIVTLADCKITSLMLPCVFVNAQSSILATNSNFEGSQTYGILLADESSAHIENCILKRNGKAAICTTGTSTVTIVGSQIEFNNDAIEINETGQVNINNSSISLNQDYGIIIKCRSFVQVKNCNFDSNKEGSVLAYNNGIFFSFDSLFKGSPDKPIIYLAGGAQMSSSGDNFSGKCLGAIASASKSEIYCENSSFSMQGSGIIANQSTITLQDISCSATVMAVQVASSFIEVKNSKFASDQTTFSLAGIRGTVINCDFTGKSIGAAINNVELRFVNCSFIGYNQAVSVAVGKPLFDQCSFKTNQTGIENNDGTLSLTNCVFEHNGTHINHKNNQMHVTKCKFLSAQQSAFIQTGGKVAITETEFKSNKTGVDASSSEILIDSCTFTSNGMFGVQVRGKSSLIISKSKFTDHFKSLLLIASRSAINDCTFEQASCGHIELMRSNVNMDNCTVSNTPCGFQVTESSMLSFVNSSVKSCEKGLNVIGPKSSASVVNVRFSQTLTPFSGDVQRIKQQNLIVE
ncbi:hypothetical protein TVAG_222740 [Trichomonas vaginalis G3]|uniref:Right handed beta helix domain-containing protein n=1 Tax=Trichomonas vaginalis (strain ATCC PRA-98 / G3) TaxID=412133 RepID=A2FHX0_TRIV3|nr:hypothetical protein TVAGG3_0347820 [Trichomonas vaginalis G3]EAX95479.1 hypothetical protein TVAG_222740 [Trichomonas vaginalis G3]KAI5531088.1 hypothetical protein TVAGG3_0347820 [Trichomonas vaginalis G3]|eukprot:XP_001308409.1 hypothetical protein [Trichomonas vaginalis G3]